MKKSQGAKSGEYGGWGITAILFFVRNLWVRTKCETGHCHGEAARSDLAKFGGNFFTQSPQNFAVEPGTHSSACWDKFFMHNPLDVKESDDHALEIAFHLSGPFLALVTCGFSTGRIVALSQSRNRKPSSHHQ